MITSIKYEALKYITGKLFMHENALFIFFRIISRFFSRRRMRDVYHEKKKQTITSKREFNTAEKTGVM